uniref:AlNc14C82G5342 protein n=1 Tax=Albugo laibachii Nc14 TaxID=890382 RepID=F0WFF3_9STRA|nr:AlNc14C82G5342 [Albugo laibachii Nc14]|eukprot:CCA19935.1 AlNc14C82G5342 [Albugo laibachii Nc14]
MREPTIGLISLLLHAATASFLNLRPDANIVLFISASRYDALALSLLLSQFEGDVAFIGIYAGTAQHSTIELPDLQFIHGMTRGRIPTTQFIGEETSDGHRAVTSLERERFMDVLKSGGLKKTIMVFSYYHILEVFLSDPNAQQYMKRIYIPDTESYKTLSRKDRGVEILSFASALTPECAEGSSHQSDFLKAQSLSLKEHTLTPILLLQREHIHFEQDYIHAACSFAVFVVMSYGLELGIIRKLELNLADINVFESDPDMPLNQHLYARLHTKIHVDSHFTVVNKWISHRIRDVPPRGIPPDQVHNLVFLAQVDRALRQMLEKFPVFTNLRLTPTHDTSETILPDLASSLSLMMDDVLRLYDTCDAIINPRVSKFNSDFSVLDAKLNAYAMKIDAFEKSLASMRKRKYDDI